MARRRNDDSRKPQRKANGAHNASPSNGTNSHVPNEARKGIQHQDQRPRKERGRGGRRGHDDRRSMSPGRDAHGEQRAHHRDNRRSRTPLATRTTHGDPMSVPDKVDHVLTKRKRVANDDDEQHANKKAHTGPGKMQTAATTKTSRDGDVPTVENDENPHKEVASLAAIKKMSEEERRKLREAKFGRMSIGPSKAVVSKAASQEPKLPELKHSVKDDRKTTCVPETESKAKAEALIPHVLGQESKASFVRQSKATTKVAVPESRGQAATKATAITPTPQQQSDGKIVSKMQVSEADRSGEVLTTANSSPASSRADMLPTNRSKRKQKEVDYAVMTPAKKAKVNHAAIKRRNDKIKQSLNDHHLYADENRFPEEGVTFVAYDAYSIPLLCSHSIEHQYPFEILNRPSDKLKRAFDNESEAEVFSRKMLLLRQEALRLSRKKFWTSEDLGRKKNLKTEPTRVIDDCDLYLYDGKVHVATEHGLLLAAVYLKLIGVADTQPVRFCGHQPAWVGLITAKPEYRRVLKTWEPTPALRDGGCISIMSGSIVVVYEHGVFDVDTKTGEESRMAYGARMDDGIAGWFMYPNTCRMDWLEDLEEISAAALDHTIIDWGKFDFGPLAARVAAQQAVQPTPEVTGQETPAGSESSASHPPVLQASVPSSPDEPVAISPTDTAIRAANKHNHESDGESTQSSVLQAKESISLLSIAGGPISRHDSPNCQSDESASGGGNDIVGEDNTSQLIITTTLPGQAMDARLVPAQQTQETSISKPHQTLPGFGGPGRCLMPSHESEVYPIPSVRSDRAKPAVSGRYDEDADWDDTDFQESEEIQINSLHNKREQEEL